MTTRKSGFLANLFGVSAREGLSAAESARAAGRQRGARRVRDLRADIVAEMLESRVMLAGDHPSLPGSFNAAAGTALTLDLASPLDNSQRGRALSGLNQGVSGTITAGDDGDFFRFVMPNTPGRPTDFVTILADTLTNPDGSNLNSTLDTYVEVYRQAQPGDPAGSVVNGYFRITVGANNGVLSSASNAPTPDGWAGFVGTAGTTYYIRVRANPAPLAQGRTATGQYTLRVDTVTTELPVVTHFVPSTVAGDPNDPLPVKDNFGEGEARGAIAFRQDEVIYRIETGSGSEWDSLATAGVIADDPAMLDTHLEVYDSGNSLGQVTTLASDIQAGRLTNAFSTWRSAPNSTFYVRARSDELAAGRPATGMFTVAVDLGALAIVTDQTTRLSTPDRIDALGPIFGSMAPQGTSSRLYQFVAQGTGTAFITVVGTATPPPAEPPGLPGDPARRPHPGTLDGSYPALTDPAVHLYNELGQLVSFNDDRNGFTPQLEVALTGGQRYFVLVEGFDRAEDGGIALFIEANYTNNTVDDHIDSNPVQAINPLNFNNATPIVWGAPTLVTDADGNATLDANWVQTGTSRGRIWEAGDTDVFQFVPPVSMLGTYMGDDGNQGRALYVGGNFATADRLNPDNIATNGRGAPNVAIWDADDWWNAGPGDELTGLSPFALQGAPSAINGQIRAFVEWDPDGAGTAFETVLIAGGQFTVDDGSPTGAPANLAMRVFVPALQRFVWAPLGPTFGSANDRVNALAVYDLDGDGPNPASLIVGGQFATIDGVTMNNLAAITFNGQAFGAAPMVDAVWGFTGIPGAASEVRALTVWDPPQPADPPDPDGGGPLPDPPQPPDPPEQLAIGGSFTFSFTDPDPDIDTITVRNLIAFGRLAPDDTVSQFDILGGELVGLDDIESGTNGPVNALIAFDDPGMNGMEEIPVQLVAAGSFTDAHGTAMGAAIQNIAVYNNVTFEWDDYGTLGTVNALTTWTVNAGGTETEFLVAGGGTVTGFVAVSPGGGAWGDLVAPPDAPVRSLATYQDDEFDSAMETEQLIFGGDFTDIDGNPFNRVARIIDQNGDGIAEALQPLKNGVDGLAPGEIGTTSVFALASFDDDVTGAWDRNERPSSRVLISVSPTADSFLNATIRIFDSTFTQVAIYSNDTIAPPFPDPAGAIDPARTAGPGFNQQFVAPGMWGGEVYYIEVTGAGTGRYEITVSVDALPPEAMDDGDGVYADDKSSFTEVPNEGRWDIAPELLINANGDGRNFDFPVGAGATPTPFQRYSANITAGGVRRQATDYLAGIETITDTDLYQFRAAATGTVEIRLSTANILDQATETLITMHEPRFDGVLNTSPSSPLLFNFQTQTTNQSRRYTSPLDGLVRVFNNDFEQIGINDDSRAVAGYDEEYLFGVLPDTTMDGTGELLTHTFRQRDARVVIPVVAGETYFIQVESAYRETFLADPTKVDWRTALGSYELVINGTPSSNGVDDFENVGNLTDTSTIPVDIATGDGEISGIIDNVPGGAFPNPNDTDLFRYVAVSRGLLRVTVDAVSPALRPIVTLFDANGQPLVSGQAGEGGEVLLTTNVTQGMHVFVMVDGDGITEGSYTVTVDGPGLEDDHVKDGDWADATVMMLDAFLGEYTASGVIENPADSDLFTFRAEAYEVATVTVAATDATLRPVVFVWEISSTAANPAEGIVEYRLVGADTSGGSTAVAQFSVTEGRDYFVVVYGANQAAGPGAHFGRYQVAVNVAATDDHPNFTAFPQATQIDLAAAFNPLTFTSNVTTAGRIEVASDDDVFRFIAPATGEATVTLTTPESGLASEILIYTSSQSLITSALSVNGTAAVTFNITANTQYYVRVRVGTTGAGQPDDTGSYSLNVATAPVDDYANEGQWASPNVGNIVLDPTTGTRTLSGIIVPDTDTDLFKFTTLAAGNVTIRVTTVGSTFNPKIRVFTSTFQEITGATSNGDTATLVFNSTGPAGTQYFVLVLPNDGATGASAVGTYSIQVIGTRPGGGPGPGPGPDDHADMGEFGDATLILLDTRTGFGSATGVINFGGDTDLFKFDPATGGRTGVQVRTPTGGLVDGRIKIYDKNFTLIHENAAGIPGATAAVEFDSVVNNASDIYYILVEPVGAATGSYTVEVSTQPTTHYLYYPEGFAGSTIDEFVPIVNPNNFPVTYTVYVRYESGPQNPNPIWSRTIQPNRRGGFTVSTKDGSSLVDRGRPYALEIQATGPLGATMSHYDFDVSVGESFTNRLSTTWTFAEVHKDPSTYRDFLVFYNPNETDATLNVELFYSNGTVRSFTQTVRSLRRGGVNIDADGRVPINGRFGVRITSNVGIVAALSSYNIVNGGGDGLLGDPDGGTTAGVIPNISSGGGVSSTLSFLNTGNAPATITITASYSRVDLPDLVRVVTVQPGRQFSRSLADLGLINSQPAGIKYVSTAPVTAAVIEYQNGDGDTTAAGTVAAKTYTFGDLFVNPAFAGVTYKETLGLFNPASTAIDVTVRFIFVDGTTSDLTVNVGAGDFGFLAVDQQTAVLSRGEPTAFSLEISAQTPIVASLTHYDLFLNGGWSTLGSPIGLTVPIATLI